MKALLTGTGAVLVTLALVASAPLASEPQTQAVQQGPRIGWVDSDSIGRGAPALVAARQQMRQVMAPLERQAEAEIGPMEEAFERAVEEFQQQQGMMTAERRQQRQQALQQQQQALQQRMMDYQRRASARQDSAMEAIMIPAMTVVGQHIDRFRQEQGYAVILDVSGGAVISADPALNLTDAVLQYLRTQANRE